jgi:hypothetical protein
MPKRKETLNACLLCATFAASIVLLHADVGNQGAWGDQGDGTYKIFNENGVDTLGPELLPASLACVRSQIDTQDGCVFAYSLDGKTFTPIGTRFAFGWHNYRGTRLGLFTYNDLGEHGRVDFNSFICDYQTH